MKNIVIDAREYSTSSGRYVEKLIKYLQEIDKVNKYYILLKPEDFKTWQPINKNFKKVYCNIKEFTFREQLKFKKIIKRLKPDLVHFTFTQQPALFKGKKITTIHDLTTIRFINPDKNKTVFKFKQNVYKRLIKKVSIDSLILITPSKFVKQDLINFTSVNSEKIEVIHEAAEKIKEKPKKINFLENKKFLMYIGRPTPHKNLEKLIKSYKQIKKIKPEVNLVLAGKQDANYLRIKDFVNNNDIEDVFFTGFVGEEELRWLYENCLAYVFPSLSEGFGLPGLEAMVHGAPVISSNATCLPEIYGDGAIYFNPEDVNDMTKKILSVIDDEELRLKQIKLGQLQAKKYSWAKTAQQTLKIYNEVL